MTDPDRLDRLEQLVAELRREVAELRGEVRAARAARSDAALPVPPLAAPLATPSRPVAPPAPSAPARAPVPLPPRLDLEDLVGRYGTVALAALLILMGVGAFLTWAVTRFTLSPASRVALGAVLAVVLAGVGLRLRAHAAAEAGDDATARAGNGARRFGDTLLALALAVVHVDAWGAGPYLGLVPTWVALGVAAAASAALAVLAWRAGEQALFVVGVGGALVAPFVTAAHPAGPFVLPAYGAIVLAVAAAALPRGEATAALPRTTDERPWDVAATLLALGGGAYVATMMGDATRVAQFGDPAGLALPAWQARRDLPAAFAVLNAAAALALGGKSYGARIALSHVTIALVALWGLALSVVDGAPSLVALAFVATVIADAALARPSLLAPSRPWPLAPSQVLAQAGVAPRALAAVLLPLGFLGAALVALERPLSTTGAALGAAWAALAAAAAWLTHARDVAASSDTDAPARAPSALAALDAAHVATAVLASALVPLLPLRDHQVAQTAALALHGALGALLLTRVRHGAVAAAVTAVLVAASALALDLLDARPAWRYVPFATLESGAAAVTVGAWLALSWAAWHTWRERDHSPAIPLRPFDAAGEPSWHAALVAVGPLAAFVWGREELSRAFSRDVATFLLVGYFAAAGIAAIWFGRTRALPAARFAGLALAIFAALKALAQVSQLEAVGLRVGSYLLVGGFLLAVGWWYRGKRDERRSASD